MLINKIYFETAQTIVNSSRDDPGTAFMLHPKRLKSNKEKQTNPFNWMILILRVFRRNGRIPFWLLLL